MRLITEQRLSNWRLGANNDLCINAKKTKEMIVDFRKVVRSLPTPLCIRGTSVEVVPSFKYLGIHIDHDLTWLTNTR